MKTNTESLKKFILIGISLFAFKSVLLVLAYALNEIQYNTFNQAYYTASILILFGSLGFNISLTRIPIKSTVILLLVTVNTVIAFLVLNFLTNPFDNYSEIIPIIIYSVFISAGGILNFRLLFEGSYKKYVIVLFMLTAAHLLIIPGVIFFHLNIFSLLAFISALWFISVYNLFNKNTQKDYNFAEFYKIGLSAFVINSAVSLGLAADKFIVNHYFTTDIANAYTFAWSATAPLFYIGTLIEKYLFAEQQPDKSGILKKGFLISTALVIGYTLGVISIVNFYPALLPSSISKEIFGSIFIFMISGYSLYVILHFPINTYLFKVLDVKKQRTISFYFTLIIILFALVFYYITNSVSMITYQMLLMAVWIYIFTLLIIKSIIMFRRKKKNGNTEIDVFSETVLEIP